MKHASAAALSRLEPLLVELRRYPDLVERKYGTFYRRSQAFLHFHEDPAGMFADARLGGSVFQRFPVNTRAEQREFLRKVGVELECRRLRTTERDRDDDGN